MSALTCTVGARLVKPGTWRHHDMERNSSRDTVSHTPCTLLAADTLQ